MPWCLSWKSEPLAVAAFFRCEGTALLVCAEAMLFRIEGVKVVRCCSVVQQLIPRTITF